MREGLMDDAGYEPVVDEKAWEDGYKQGAEDMEKAKQIIIDSLLDKLKTERSDAIDEMFLMVMDAYHSDILDECELCRIERELKENKNDRR